MNPDSYLVNVLGMRVCTRVHDELLCTHLQNYMTTVYRVSQ